jgi:hypothetical protein
MQANGLGREAGQGVREGGVAARIKITNIVALLLVLLL